MDKKQYRSLSFWVIVLCVCLLAGYCFLAILSRDRPVFIAVMTVLVIGILVAMIRTVRKLGAFVEDTQKEKNNEKS
jgi:hypothetical protein